MMRNLKKLKTGVECVNAKSRLFMSTGRVAFAYSNFRCKYTNLSADYTLSPIIKNEVVHLVASDHKHLL